MTVQTTSNLSNALRAQYLEDYIAAAKMVRLYDQLAEPIGKDMATLTKGSSVVVNFLGDMEPGSTTISETSDVVPVTIRDATVSISPTSRWGAIQVSEKLLNQAYTPYGAERFAVIGKNQMETVDVLAMTQAVNCAVRSSYKNAARSSVDSASNYYLRAAAFANAQADLETLKVPSFLDAGRNMWASLIHPYGFADLRADTTITAVGEYQKANIILSHELGELGPFKLVVSPWVHTFWAAGATKTTAIATTIASSATANRALDLTIEVAASTNIAAGDWLLIGTIESGTTLYPTNERVMVTSAYSSGTTINIAGEGANGGLRFDHAVNATVSNADSVGCATFGGPKSLAKIFDVNTGEFGQVVGPKRQGLLDQFESLGWKFYGQYARPSETWIQRYEYAFSRDNT